MKRQISTTRPSYWFLCILLANTQSFAKNNTVSAEANIEALQKIEITGGGYFFQPEHIILKINVPVELRVKKESGFVPHDITMDSPEAGMKFSESLETDFKTIKFTPTAVGQFPFYCDGQLLFFESHRDKGMQGMIEVIE